MDQKVNSPVHVVVLSEHMNFPLSVSPSKEMGEHTRKRKKSFTSAILSSQQARCKSQVSDALIRAIDSLISICKYRDIDTRYRCQWFTYNRRTTHFLLSNQENRKQHSEPIRTR